MVFEGERENDTVETPREIKKNLGCWPENTVPSGERVDIISSLQIVVGFKSSRC